MVKNLLTTLLNNITLGQHLGKHLQGQLMIDLQMRLDGSLSCRVQVHKANLGKPLQGHLMLIFITA